MSDYFENSEFNQTTAKSTCRVAYTINNHQPVISTIIGEQPLFYLDHQDYDEDDSFDAGALGLLEDELHTLRKSIAEFDRYYASREVQESADQGYNDFIEQCDGLTNNFKARKDGTLAAALDILGKSRLGAAYLEFTAEHGVKIAESQQVEDGFYDREAGKILMNPSLDTSDFILSLVRELRTHWQHRQGALIQPLMFHPDNAILINRAQGADRAVSMVRIAWELQLAGEKSVWKALENSPMGDLARCYARESFLDFRTINNGVASAAIFESFFLSERCRTQDKDLIQQMLADYQGYVFEDDNNSQGLTANIIAALGEMPYGKNYLAAHASTIMSDPIFTEVRDRSNANFLWFIKFERTFRETEQELQSGVGPSEDDVLASSTHKTKKDQNNDQTGSADIITLYAAKSAAAYSDSDSGFESGKILASTQTRIEDADTANVVFLHHRGAE